MSFQRHLLPDPASYFEAQGLKLTGPRSAKWKTTACQFHGGSDSMRINMHSGGWCCMSCNAKGGDVLAYEIHLHGSEFQAAARALGAWQDDGKPSTHHRPTTLSPRAALEVLGFESTLVAVAAGNLAKGVTLTQADRLRVMAAAGRIGRLVQEFT